MNPSDTVPTVATLTSSLTGLATALRGLSFAATPRVTEHTAAVERLAWSIDGYLLPRLADLGAPAVAVLIGSTGAGKSSLLNAIAGADVTRAGAVRPTTLVPTVWAHASNAHRYDDTLLPSLREDGTVLTLATHDDATWSALTLIDTPDVDSVVADHRVIAEEVLAVADICIYVTTAQRYADAVPWEILRGVADRRIPLVVVLNRVPDHTGTEVAEDLSRRLWSEGVTTDRHGTELITIAEHAPGGTLAEQTIAQLRTVLLDLVTPAQRTATVAAAVAGTVRQVTEDTRSIAAAVEDERRITTALEEAAERAYAAQASSLTETVGDGVLIRGEVLARWQEFVGTGELLRLLGDGAGRVRGWARRVFGGTADAAMTVRGEAGSQLADTIVRRADGAAIATAGAWELTPTGAALLRGDLWRADPATADRARRAVDGWLSELTLLIESEGGGRRRIAQVASLGVNAVAVVLMLAVFAQTGGLTGTEVGVAAGAAALQQRVLEHLFGGAAAKALIQRASDRLTTMVNELLLTDRSRFDAAVAAIAMSPTASAELRSSADAVAAALDARDLFGGSTSGGRDRA